ncbi:hypothetical protein L484_018529 [Morus notabilis]|uniref:PGG domain-containing protein n=1 Tax=Morus notabilis TaxID=981085 RepID=W9SBP4_9ROSA|nr:hypothetical protein L484_018529 [Morus notabilis]
MPLLQLFHIGHAFATMSRTFHSTSENVFAKRQSYGTSPIEITRLIGVITSEVKKTLPAFYMDLTNAYEKTPQEIFDGRHNELLNQGLKWIKTATEAGFIIAGINASSIAVTAFIGMPGGYDSGRPHFLREVDFDMFVLADITSFAFTVAALAIFWSIKATHSTGYAVIKKSHPRLTIGTTLILFAMIMTMTALGAGLSRVLQQKDTHKHNILSWSSIAILSVGGVLEFFDNGFPPMEGLSTSLANSIVHTPPPETS